MYFGFGPHSDCWCPQFVYQFECCQLKVLELEFEQVQAELYLLFLDQDQNKV